MTKEDAADAVLVAVKAYRAQGEALQATLKELEDKVVEYRGLIALIQATISAQQIPAEAAITPAPEVPTPAAEAPEKPKRQRRSPKAEPSEIPTASEISTESAQPLNEIADSSEPKPDALISVSNPDPVPVTEEETFTEEPLLAPEDSLQTSPDAEEDDNPEELGSDTWGTDEGDDDDWTPGAPETTLNELVSESGAPEDFTQETDDFDKIEF